MGSFERFRALSPRTFSHSASSHETSHVNEYDVYSGRNVDLGRETPEVTNDAQEGARLVATHSTSSLTK